MATETAISIAVAAFGAASVVLGGVLTRNAMERDSVRDAQHDLIADLRTEVGRLKQTEAECKRELEVMRGEISRLYRLIAGCS